jgi:hypothetical protein
MYGKFRLWYKSEMRCEGRMSGCEATSGQAVFAQEVFTQEVFTQEVFAQEVFI